MLLGIFLLLQSFSFAEAGAQCHCTVPDKLSVLSENLKTIALNLETSKFNYQDGPNCFNAVFYAKGYVTERTKMDDTEFAFYLERFCQKKTDPEAKGDVIAFQSEGGFYHAALALGDGKIFEKLSTWGRNPPEVFPKVGTQQMLAERKESSQYRIKNKNESKYFNGVDKTVGKPHVYRCPDLKDVQRNLETLSLEPGVQKIQKLNRKLEKLIFRKKPGPHWKEDTATLISKTLSEINLDEVRGEAAKFLRAKLKSLESQMWDFDSHSKSEKFIAEKSKIKSMINVLETKF